MDKKNILIVGAGELGSRHLQGALKSNYDLNVFCVDPSETSLDTARVRAQEIKNKHKLVFLSNYESVPRDLFLVIVATSSNVREIVVTEIYARFVVKNMILEKVLFQEDKSFVRVSSIVEKHKDTKVWVNHPRRMFDHYKQIKDFLKPSMGNDTTVFISGGAWGLACNSLHYIDLVEYLFDDELASIETNGVHNLLLESKRNNFIEMTGSLEGVLKTGVKFFIEERDPKIVAAPVILINLKNRSLVIQEGALPFYILIDNEKGMLRKDIVNLYQSDLTTQLVDGLIAGEELLLPRFEHSILTHRIVIAGLLKKYNEITKFDNTKLPIT